MSTLVSDKIGAAAYDGGTLLGLTEPTRETKGTWWEVYYHGGKIIACVCGETGFMYCAEEISRDKIGMYVDDEEAAIKKLDELAASEGEKGETKP